MTRRTVLAIAIMTTGWWLSRTPGTLPTPSAPQALVTALTRTGITRVDAGRFGAACVGVAELLERGDQLTTCSQIGDITHAIGVFAGQFGSVGENAKVVIADHLSTFTHTGPLTAAAKSDAVRLFRELGAALHEVSR